MAWGGYLIEEFPAEYIKAETYDTNPNQREEIRAYRDDYSRNLYRITAPGKKTKISFSTRDILSLEEMTDIQNFFTERESSSAERKCNIKFWDAEEQIYKEADFYRPNISYVVDHYDSETIYYKGQKITLIEY